MSTLKLEERVAVITGGTSGIGRSAAHLFSREGARVVVASNHPAAGAATESELRNGGADGTFVETDVTRPAEIERLINTTMERHGRIDVILSNAGLVEMGTAQETSVESWNRLIAVNLTAHFFVAKYGLPALAASGGGSLILTASELGLVGSQRSVAYCAAKGGVVNMVRALAVDAGASGVRVNCLAPGPTRTPMLAEWLGPATGRPARESAQVSPILLGRIAEPDEVAAAALFLASDDSSFTTGSVQVVDGGVTSWYGM